MSSLVFMAAIAALLAALLLSRRDLLVYLMVPALLWPPFFAFGAAQSGWALVPTSSRLAIAILVCLAFADRLARDEGRLVYPPSLAIVLIHAVLVTASLGWAVIGVASHEPEVVFMEYAEWLLPVLAFCLIASRPADEKTLQQAANWIGAGVLVMALVSVAQGLAIIGITRWVPAPIVSLVEAGQAELWFASFRVYGTLPNLGPNFFGAALLFPTLLAFSRCLTTKRWARLAWSAILVGGITSIALTYSRGAQLGLLAGMCVLLILRRRYGLLAMATGGVVATTIALADVGVIRNALSLVADGRLDVDAEARVNVWRSIWAATPTHPLGFGFNGWLRASVTQIVGAADPRVSVGGAHAADNMWMRELADRGVVGVLVLMSLLATFTLVALRRLRATESGSARYDWLATSVSGTVGAALAMGTGDHLMYLNVAGVFWFFQGMAQSAVLDPTPESGVVGRSDEADPLGTLAMAVRAS